MHYEIADYLVSTVDNKYTESITFENIEEHEIKVSLYVECRAKISPIMWMIEANMITKRELRAKHTKLLDDKVIIETLDDITYIIKLVANKK